MINGINSADSYLPPTNVGAGRSIDTSNQPAFQQSESKITVADAGQYLTPVLKIDPKTHIAIYEQRDPSTGKVLNQYPSEKVVEQYQKADQQSGSPLTDAKTNTSPATIQAAPLPVVAVAVPNTSVGSAPVTNPIQAVNPSQSAADAAASADTSA